jgi:hypothetical protein
MTRSFLTYLSIWAICPDQISLIYSRRELRGGGTDDCTECECVVVWWMGRGAKYTAVAERRVRRNSRVQLKDLIRKQ